MIDHPSYLPQEITHLWWMIIIQNNTSKVEYAYLVVVVECVHTGGGACQYLSCTQC